MNPPRLTIPIVSALAAAAVALTTAAPPPAAAAAYTPPRVYSVTAEGTGTFHYELSLPNGPETGDSVKRDVSFDWNVKLPSVAFLSNGEGVPVNTGGGQAEGSVTGDGTEETTIVGDDGHGGHVTTHASARRRVRRSRPASH